MTFRRPYAFVALVIWATAILVSISGCATRLLVLSGYTRAIHRYDGSTGAPLGIFVPAGSGGLGLPWEMVFGPDGKVYVTSTTATSADTLGVLRFDGRTGAFVDVFVPSGSGGLSNPTGLSFGPDCSLYVTSRDTHGGVLRYQGSTGAFVDAFVPSGSGGLDFPTSLVFGPDGNLYVTDFAKGQVLRYHGGTGAFLGAFVPAGSGGLDNASGLVFGPDGNLYVAGRKAVLRYDGKTGAFIDAFVPESGGLKDAYGLVFGPDGDLYVTSAPIFFDPAADAVRRYDGNTGAFIEVFIQMGSGGLYLPLSLAFIPRPVTKQIDTLLVAVEKLGLPADIEKAFKNPLQNARAAIDAGSLVPARNQLGTFTDTVRANTGNLIPVPQANRLVIAANAIRDRLRCS
jgi:streptogramin lyase